jgi:prepilin-type processing-associated H-X9-DG protein
VSTYSELNLDRALGRAPETAALGPAFAQMKSPQLIRELWAELAKDNPEMAKFAEALGMAKSISDALGPGIGWATWIPDAQALMGGMMGGMAAGGDAKAAMAMMPKVLLVADLRDAAKFDALVSQLAGEAGLDVRVTEGAGTKTMSFANGMVDLIRGDNWVAIGFPPEGARKAADLAGGAATDSLASDPGYQQVFTRLPVDAILTEYVSAASLKQLLALANVMAPTAGISYQTDEPLAVATGVRVEEVQGRKMATAYYTGDLDAIAKLLDGVLSLEAVVAKPAFERSRATARKAVCTSNMKNLALAAQMFATDHENQLPDGDRWVAELEPYVKSQSVFQCPEDKSGAACSYAMNKNLSGKSLDDLEDASLVVLFYETAKPDDNPVGDPSEAADPPRHLGGNNVAYADGHVKWLGPEEEEQPSFEIDTGEEERGNEEM